MHMDVALPSASARQDARSSAAEAAAFPGSAAGSGLRAGEGLPKQVGGSPARSWSRGAAPSRHVPVRSTCALGLPS